MERRSSKASEFRASDVEGSPQIEAYFAVFSDIYEMYPGGTESIDPHAFDDALSDDIRCLIDHDTTLVLGRTKVGTLTLSVDNYGLKGVVKINPDDTDAMNLYARVKRGDVSQCSFGFDILRDELESRPDGTYHWIIKSVKLYEVSIVTFPAYEKTEAEARDRRAGQAFEVSNKHKEQRAALDERRSSLQKREADAAAALEELTADSTPEERAAVEAEVTAIETDTATLDADEQAHEAEQARLDGIVADIEKEIKELDERSAPPQKKPTEKPAERKDDKNMETRTSSAAHSLRVTM